MDLLHSKRVIDSQQHEGKEEVKTVEEGKALQDEERNFEPGRHDVSDIFFITPNKFYGRETDLVKILLKTYKRACSSRTSQVILVTGYAGKIYTEIDLQFSPSSLFVSYQQASCTTLNDHAQTITRSWKDRFGECIEKSHFKQLWR